MSRNAETIQCCGSFISDDLTLTEGGSIIEIKKQFESIGKPGDIPGFRHENHTYQFLNRGLDIEVDGVTYHLFCEFADEGEMGTVIDTIELERSKKNSA